MTKEVKRKSRKKKEVVEVQIPEIIQEDKFLTEAELLRLEKGNLSRAVLIEKKKLAEAERRIRNIRIELLQAEIKLSEQSSLDLLRDLDKLSEEHKEWFASVKVSKGLGQDDIVSIDPFSGKLILS